MPLRLEFVESNPSGTTTFAYDEFLRIGVLNCRYLLPITASKARRVGDSLCYHMPRSPEPDFKKKRSLLYKGDSCGVDKHIMHVIDINDITYTVHPRGQSRRSFYVQLVGRSQLEGPDSNGQRLEERWRRAGGGELQLSLTRINSAGCDTDLWFFSLRSCPTAATCHPHPMW